MDDTQFRQIIAQIRDGDNRAMSCLLVGSFAALRSAVTRHMDDVLVRAGFEPEDIMQEAYAAAWPELAAARFENYVAFLGWLKQIAERKLIDMRRAVVAEKRDVRRQVPGWDVRSGSYINLFDYVTATNSTPSRGAARREALAIMMVNLVQLPDEYRRVLQWRLIDGLPVPEVARLLDRSEAAVHMLCHRALKKLKHLMGPPSRYLSEQ